MIAPFEASRIKIDRAKRHLQELQSQIDAYFARDSIFVVCEKAQEFPNAMVAWTIKIKEHVPNDLSAVIGDVLHNLRTSLDLLACDLVRMSDPKARVNNVHYPFCDTKAELKRTIERWRLHKLKDNLIKAIEATAPYKNGNEGLRAIHDLDILDKHTALVPVVSIAAIPELKIRCGNHINTITGWGAQVAGDGQRMVFIPADMSYPIGAKIPATFEFVFSVEGNPFNGRNLTDQLDRCVIGVENILSLFKRVALE